jgi:hypothetical protein
MDRLGGVLGSIANNTVPFRERDTMVPCGSGVSGALPPLGMCQRFRGPVCHTARNGLLLNLRANRWRTLVSSNCKCSLNQQMLDDSMTTAQRLSPKAR